MLIPAPPGYSPHAVSSIIDTVLKFYNSPDMTEYQYEILMVKLRKIIKNNPRGSVLSVFLRPGLDYISLVRLPVDFIYWRYV